MESEAIIEDTLSDILSADCNHNFIGLFNSSLIMVITLLLDLTLDKEIRSGCTSLASLKGTHFRLSFFSLKF